MSWIGRNLIYGELPSETRAFALEALGVRERRERARRRAS